jgi:hypothetical protein
MTSMDAAQFAAVSVALGGEPVDDAPLVGDEVAGDVAGLTTGDDAGGVRWGVIPDQPEKFGLIDASSFVRVLVILYDSRILNLSNDISQSCRSGECPSDWSWKQMTFPEFYWITETEYRCLDCQDSFSCRTSQDNVLVKFVDDENRMECWLPTFEKGGYLDLIEKCVPGFRRNDQITMKVFHIFESEFMKYQHGPKSGGFWKVACGCKCPQCRSSHLKVLSEVELESPVIDWMTYDAIP